MFADSWAWRCAMGLAALLLFGHGSRVLAADRQVLAPDGVTPAEAWVTTTSEHGGSGSNTLEDGRFDLRHRPAGRYRISATGMNGPARSMDAPEHEVTVTEDQHIEGIKLILQPAPFIRGTIAGLSPAVSSATLVERAGTVVIAVVPVSLDVAGVGNLPPSLAGHTFTIDVYGYELFLVSTWDGGPSPN